MVFVVVGDVVVVVVVGPRSVLLLEPPQLLALQPRPPFSSAVLPSSAFPRPHAALAAAQRAPIGSEGCHSKGMRWYGGSDWMIPPGASEGAARGRFCLCPTQKHLEPKINQDNNVRINRSLSDLTFNLYL